MGCSSTSNTLKEKKKSYARSDNIPSIVKEGDTQPPTVAFVSAFIYLNCTGLEKLRETPTI